MKNESCDFKDNIYEQFARIGKAVSSPKRLELLDILSQGARTVEVLAKETHQTVANTSQHLNVLRAAHLVDAKKNGLFVTYSLADKAVYDLFLTMRKLAEKMLAEVEQIKKCFFSGKEGLEPVNREELLMRVKEGQAAVLDVRPKEEYLAGHISGAISIPLSELEARISELPKDKDIVAYCRGPYCLLAIHAVEILRKKGFSADWLEESVIDWQEQGGSVDVSSKKGE